MRRKRIVGQVAVVIALLGAAACLPSRELRRGDAGNLVRDTEAVITFAFAGQGHVQILETWCLDGDGARCFDVVGRVDEAPVAFAVPPGTYCSLRRVLYHDDGTAYDLVYREQDQPCLNALPGVVSVTPRRVLSLKRAQFSYAMVGLRALADETVFDDVHTAHPGLAGRDHRLALLTPRQPPTPAPNHP